VLAACCLSAQANVSVNEQRTLDFGLIATGPTTGPVTVTPFGSISCGPHTCLGGHQADRLKVSGNRNGVYDVSYSSGDVLTHVVGGATIPIGNFSDSAGGTIVLNSGGQAQFFVGGQLILGPLTPGGEYAGTFTIIFNLQ